MSIQVLQGSGQDLVFIYFWNFQVLQLKTDYHFEHKDYEYYPDFVTQNYTKLFLHV